MSRTPTMLAANRFFRLCRSAMLVALVIAASQSSSASATEIDVRLANGRHFVGHLQKSARPSHLRLTSAGSATRVTRSIPWNQIVASTIAGRPVSPQQLRALKGGLATVKIAPLPQRVPAAATSESYALRALKLLGFGAAR